MALKLKIGSPVAGEDFFGRNAELQKAETLIEYNNLMLAAPRRVGVGYLVRTDNLYRFRSPLLRDYWKVTYC